MSCSSCGNKNMLSDVSAKYGEALKGVSRRVIVCAGTGCVAGGSLKVFAALNEEITKRGVPVVVELKAENVKGSDNLQLSKSGCQGFCQMGPLVTIEPEGIFYTRVTVEDVPEIVEKTIVAHETVERLLYQDRSSGTHCKGTKEIAFYTQQHRSVLENCGRVDPDDISEYIHQGGYEAARRAWCEMKPEELCEEITKSGLRGRGGGGFPTGRKWSLTLKEQSDQKYVICNGDEGDPGAFMDRSVMEGNPHSVVEGMMIAARAIGASQGYFYIRAEYPLAVKRIRKAVADAEALGLLGDNIFGSGQSLKLNIMEGAGAFVCGEETALMASIEGQRGMPRPKPPFPAQQGLWGKPTVINNVETLATVPLILNQGSEVFRRIGTKNSPGTKTFALTGHVVNTGLIEVPFGTTLRDIVFRIGGGVIDDSGNLLPDGFKAVQTGGPSGGCLSAEHLDLPIDFDSLQSVGSMVGSGGMVVMNKNTCIVGIARFFMQFTQNESCGKCVFCREGTKQMLSLLDDIIEGRADAETLKLLEQLAVSVRKGSLCGLGKTAPNPVLSMFKNFRPELEAHVFQKRCPAGKCKALLTPEIDPTRCKGCTACVRQCPVGAISGEKKQPHRIDPNLCVKCGSCAKTCKFGAITGVGA